MALSPAGSMNFINQNMTYPATQISNELAKESFAATLNMAGFNEKEKTLNKLEKVSEIHELKEEIKEKFEQEEKKKKHKQETNNDEENTEEDLTQESDFKDIQSIHYLDMSI